MLQFSISKAPVMTTRFEAYGRTPRVSRLAAIIRDPARDPEYRGFLARRLPGGHGRCAHVRPELEPLRRSDRREFDAAKRFVGWAVATVMRDQGYKIIGRSRVPGGLFTVGAIWNGEPKVPYSPRPGCKGGSEPRSAV
jgi:hypothetical protein